MSFKITLCGENLINHIVVLCTEENMEQVATVLKLFMSSLSCAEELRSLSFTQGVKFDMTQSNLKFQGRWLPEKNEIQIKHYLSPEKMLQTLIFELCNANNPDLVKSKIKYSNFFTADEYAIYIEKAEHQSDKKACLLYMDIISRNPNELEMPNPAELAQLKIVSEEQNYLDYVKNNGHYENYVKNYNNAMRNQNNFFQELKKNDLEDEKDLLQIRNLAASSS